MNILLRLSSVVLSLGMLGAAACSSCSPPPEEKSGPSLNGQSYTCGAGTRRVGNQCVANGVNGQPVQQGTRAGTLSTKGNN